MSITRTIKNPNLLVYPGVHTPRPTKDEWSTLGDLHGNPVKLLYFMVVEGAITISKEDYELFAYQYINCTPDTAIAEFNTILDRITVNKDAHIRLIGDTLADRGKRDDITLALMNKFSTQGGTLEILLSNHDEIFITMVEAAIEAATKATGVFDLALFKKIFCETKETSLGGSYSASFQNLQAHLAKTTDLAECQTMLDQYHTVKKHFKALSYDYNPQGDLILYSHAATSTNFVLEILLAVYATFTAEEQAMFKQVAAYFDTHGKLESQEQWIPLCNVINRLAKEAATDNYLADFLDGHLFTILNNRYTHGDNDTRNVHGHDPLSWNAFSVSLDTLCGRGFPFTDEGFDFTDPNFTAIFTQDMVIARTLVAKPNLTPQTTATQKPLRLRETHTNVVLRSVTRASKNKEASNLQPTQTMIFKRSLRKPVDPGIVSKLKFNGGSPQKV